jgi:hypothetical protein
MQLTKARLRALISEAYRGISDCHQIIDIHDRQSSRKVLNPYLVLSVVSAWERFILNLLGASTKQDWNPKMHDERSSPAPWPGGKGDQNWSQNHGGRHYLDSRLIDADVLEDPITSYWKALVSTDYRGSDPRKWRLGSFSPGADEESASILRQRTARRENGSRCRRAPYLSSEGRRGRVCRRHRELAFHLEL